MPGQRKREPGRGEKTAPGIWRLRLPLPWPGVPHGNAWALKAGDGIVLVDTGIHDDRSGADLELAMAQVGLRLEDVSLLLCTHAHSDHYGQAALITERSGCELWMHPNYEHVRKLATDPDGLLEDRLARGLRAGVPPERIERARELRRGSNPGIERLVAPDRPLDESVTFETDHGEWQVIETPGHAPSHVCFFCPEKRLLLSGDHLLGKITLYYDFGYTPDPVGEYLSSLEKIRGLGARLCLSGHGRTFTDIIPHIDGNVELVTGRVETVAEALAEGPLTAYEITPRLNQLREGADDLILLETFCYLGHLEAAGRATKSEEDGIERWQAA